jgi:hypothetical protein
MADDRREALLVVNRLSQLKETFLKPVHRGMLLIDLLTDDQLPAETKGIARDEH